MFSKQSPGFGLIEVLIAVFILSTGILALLQLQWFANQHHQQMMLQAIAHNHINQLLEQTPLFAMLDASVLNNWQKNIRQRLPEGKGNLERRQGIYEVMVAWQGKPLVAPCCRLTRARSE